MEADYTIHSEHIIQVSFMKLICSCGWKCDFAYELTWQEIMKELEGAVREAIQTAINAHKEEFMKDGEYILLAPGSTTVIYKLKSLCTAEEIEESQKWA